MLQMGKLPGMGRFCFLRMIQVTAAWGDAPARGGGVEAAPKESVCYRAPG